MTASLDAPRFTPVGDGGLLVEFATEISEAANDAVIALDRAIGDTDFDGLIEVVPAYVNLLVVFDPVRTDHAAVESMVRAVLPHGGSADGQRRHHVVPVCYDEQFAPDLDAVAEATGLTVEAVINTQLAAEYRVALYGFAPGYAYMSGVPTELQLPRKASPVRGVPADSLIIAGPQCLVTTLEMPAGWWVLGRSATSILRPTDADPFLFDVGDRVSFRRIDLATFDELAAGT